MEDDLSALLRAPTLACRSDYRCCHEGCLLDRAGCHLLATRAVGICLKELPIEVWRKVVVNEPCDLSSRCSFFIARVENQEPQLALRSGPLSHYGAITIIMHHRWLLHHIADWCIIVLCAPVSHSMKMSTRLPLSMPRAVESPLAPLWEKWCGRPSQRRLPTHLRRG